MAKTGKDLEDCMKISDAFPRYTMMDPEVPVWCITPGEGRCIHRFFDTSPFSPSGRFAAVFRFPFENRRPKPGDEGEVVLIDLETAEERVVARTRGWDTQMGANINWGADDSTLLFNDVDTRTWECFATKLDPHTGRSERIGRGIYHASPDGRKIATADMPAMRRTQLGYGVVIPDELVRRNIGAPDDDGLFITDVDSGETRLALPLSEAAKAIPELQGGADGWEVYGFHSKFSPRGDRIVFTVRRFPKQDGPVFDVLDKGAPRLRFDVLTLRLDGTDVHDAVAADQWEKHGHHINWFPDGESLSMNLNIDRDQLRLCRVGYDGSGLENMLGGVIGSGHPTVHPDGRHILTDAYRWEPCAVEERIVPLRWIDRSTGGEKALVRIGVVTEPVPDSSLRVDPHPAWDRTWRWVAFNGVAGDKTRRVFVADMESVIGE